MCSQQTRSNAVVTSYVAITFLDYCTRGTTNQQVQRYLTKKGSHGSENIPFSNAPSMQKKKYANTLLEKNL